MIAMSVLHGPIRLVIAETLNGRLLTHWANLESLSLKFEVLMELSQTENARGCHPICSDLEKNIYQFQLVTTAEQPLFRSFQWFAGVAIPSVL